MWRAYSCIVLVLCLSFVVAKVDESMLTDELKKLMSTIHKTCVDKIGVEEADVEKLKTGEFVDNEKNKCYVQCVLSESGTMDESGEIDLPALSEVVPENIRDTVKNEFESCAKKQEGISDHCEKAYAIVKCVHELDPDNFYFV